MSPGPIRRGRGRPRKTAAAATPYARPSQEQIKAEPATIVIDSLASSTIQADSKEPDTPAPAPAPVASEPVKRLRKGPFVKKGHKEAEFQSNAQWDRSANDYIGSSTTKLSFGSGFILTDAHLEDIFTSGSKVLQKLTHFTCKFNDVSDTAHNSAVDLTDAALIRLAKHCPRLQRCQLQGTAGLTSATLAAFFNFCPALTYLEITPHIDASNKLDGSAFEMLENQPSLVPKLRTLRLDSRGKKAYMQKMKTLGKARGNLAIQLVEVSESKKWGDWELDVHEEVYRKGKRYEAPFKIPTDYWY
ncbi:hypothetical protein F5B18DRAFT_648189 [Nemania serpens]|nr:hypothetical protein F5B18DRAFT_648189 [Nemania serpens]